MNDDDLPSEAPGWDAIDNALYPIYGNGTPHHFGTVVPYSLGGPDPIHGLSAYKNEASRTHWHFVTYGFSDLWEKENTDPNVSGFGFELTFRVLCQPSDSKPPHWALNFLQNLGRYVFDTGHGFGVGHTMPLNGPIQQGSSTVIHAICFILDPQLPRIETPNGRVEFLQVVGVTMDELEAISSWNAEAFLELRKQYDPMLITDLQRGSWMAERPFADKVAQRTEEEGSSCGWLNIKLECETKSSPVCVRVQTIAVDSLKRRLLGRLPYGRELILNDQHGTVLFKPGTTTGCTIVEDAMTITLPNSHLIELASSLKPHAGKYGVPGTKDIIIEVVRTEIKDNDGKVVSIVE